MIPLPFAASPRRAVAATFGAFGFNSGVWAGASAAVVGRIGVGAFQFGAALTVMTVLYLAAMSAAGSIASRIGVRRTLLAGLLTMGPTMALLLSARTSLWLGLALALFGVIAGLLDSAMNAEGSRVEHRSAKPIFAQFHAFASAATATGAALGGWLDFQGLGWLAAFLVEATLLAAALMVTRAISDPPGERSVGGVTVPRAIDAGLVALGLAIGVSIVCETSALSWAALLLRNTAPRLAAFAGLGAAFFAGFQAAMRFGIDRLRQSFGDRSLMLTSYAVAAVGLALVGANVGFGGSAFGFAILGAGTGAIVPCGFSLAARRPGLSAGAAISAVSFFGLAPRAPAPLLTGFVAVTLSLSSAFYGLAAFMLAALVAVVFFVPSVPRSAKLAPGGVSP